MSDPYHRNRAPTLNDLLFPTEAGTPNRRMRTRMSGGVTGKAGDSLPMSINGRLGLVSPAVLRRFL
jgi:hypothetical protein